MNPLQVLDLLFFAATSLANITLYAETNVPLPPMTQVAYVEFSTAPYVLLRLRPKTEEENCRYSGLVVPYERTWEEVIEDPTAAMNGGAGSPTVLPPEPGKIAAYAILINKKTCEGRAPEAMFRVAGYDYSRKISGGRTTLQTGYMIRAEQLASIPADRRPQWVDQVTATVSKAAETNQAARSFVEFSQAAAKTEKKS